MAESKPTDAQRVLLPDHLKPSRYFIHISPEIEASTFTGTVTMDLEVVKATEKNSITCHSLELELDKTQIKLKRYNADGTTVSSESTTDTFETNAEEETVTFNFGGEPFKVGEKLSLFLAFSGVIGEAISGLYHSNYTINGESRKGISTQFEAVDARRAFPCFDEPALKAVFSVSLTVNDYYVALGNMPVEKEEKSTKDGVAKKTLHFAPTPKMSTYLVCFAVGEYDSIEAKTQSGVVVRVWAKHGEAHLGQYALDVGTRTLDFYEKFFGIKYPLPKMDMIALANMGGAMENWGLVTYRDNALLCDPTKASLRQRMTILTIVTHELGHQWFGNLVTMEWWKELWLNEGFASWVETHAADVLYPEYRAWDDFCRVTLSGGLELDSLLSSHPIEVEVFKSRDVDEIFDSISYNKGAGVIRMLASYIGIEAFAKGLGQYLSKYAYTNAKTADLWNSLSESTHLDIRSLMHPWTSNMGYPVIFIETDKLGKVLKFRQQRFLASGKPEDKDDQVVWPIRLTVQTKNQDPTVDQSKIHLKATDANSLISGVSYIEFDGREHSVDFDTANLSWFKANVNQVGFFRVIYHPDLFNKILRGLENGDFSPIDRWGLINDAFATCLAGLTGIHDLFSLLERFKSETDNTVLGEIAANFGELEVVFGKQFGAQIDKFKREIFSAAFTKLGWEKEGETEHERAARPIVLSVMASVGEQSVIDECRKRFALMADGDYDKVSPTLWGLVLNTTAKYGTKEDVEKFKKLTKSLTNSMAVNQTVRALGCIADRALLKETLEWAFLSDDLVTGNVPRMVFGASESQVGREVSWEVFQAHFETIEKRLHKGPFLFAMTIEASTIFASSEKADEVAKFFEKTKIVGVDRTIEQSIDKIRGRATIANRSQSALASWFSSHGY